MQRHPANHWFIGWPATQWTPPRQPRDWLTDLPTDLAARLTPVASADWHVTLAFLGACEPPAAHAAWECAVERMTTDPTLATPLTVRPLGFCLLGRNAVALRVDADGDGLARRITAHRDAIRQAAGLVAEDRDALPHVTVARLTRRAPRNAVEDWARMAPVSDTSCRLSPLTLYTRSDQAAARFARVLSAQPPA